MSSRVEGDLFGDLFPERVELWEHLHSGNRLQNLAEKYLKLYDECSCVCDKDAELFLRWLDVMRSFTCKEAQTEETKALLIQILDGLSVSDVTQQTMLAIIHLGLCKQMAETVEEISLAIHESADLETSGSKPSDDVALHRICGWALRSAANHLRTQMSTCASQEHNRLSSQLELTRFLKLPDSVTKASTVSRQRRSDILQASFLALDGSNRSQYSRIIEPEILQSTLRP